MLPHHKIIIVRQGVASVATFTSKLPHHHLAPIGGKGCGGEEGQIHTLIELGASIDAQLAARQAPARQALSEDGSAV
jgi:hypothetical protein